MLKTNLILRTFILVMSLLVILNANIIFVAAESDQSGPTKDYQVEDAQKWVNDNYGSIIGEIKEDGTSRAATFGALIKALQIELNVTNSPVANFGPGTAAAFDKLNLNMNRTKDGKEDNICYILNHALWVKGYNCGYKDKGLYDESTLEAVSQIKVDMGFYDMTMVSLERTALEISTIDSSIMKAIMNTDSYTIVDKTGDEKVRSMQQELNRNYYKYCGIMPCDGHFGRQTIFALTYAFQIAIGIGDSSNGNFGPGTISKCPTLSLGDSREEIVKYVQYALYFNGFKSMNIKGNYDVTTQDMVKKFQSFLCLPVTGIADMPTIKALFTSNGYTGREPNACDFSYQNITSAEAKQLKARGINYAGRYLTSVGSFIKHLTIQERDILLDAGLNIIPIFQTYGNKASYFTEDQGYNDFLSAIKAVRNLGINSNAATVYFAVDFDSYDYQVDENIIPYFKGIRQASSDYSFSSPFKIKIGVYGPRNICSRLSSLGLTSSSYVSGMSSGFSGNMGFPMPKNWAFNQYVEKSSGTGGVNFDIDYVTARNLIDLGVNANQVTKTIDTTNSNVDIEPVRNQSVINTPVKRADMDAAHATVKVNRSENKIPVYNDYEFTPNSHNIYAGSSSFGNPIGYINPNDFYVKYQHEPKMYYRYTDTETTSDDTEDINKQCMIGNTYENQLLTSSEISAWESYYTYEINHCRVIFRDESGVQVEGYIVTHNNQGFIYDDERDFVEYNSQNNKLVASTKEKVAGEECYVFNLTEPLEHFTLDGKTKGILPVGSKIAISASNKSVQTGVKKKWCIYYDYYLETGETDWKSEGVIDLGFIYGVSPSDRALK